mmetsp:Transcript_13822/g.60366  ORF Transcript_13822/g.60366 Transcript_13822/m.60366 type:complete len:301 (+) Transcript_13822:799-1701(+)
MRVSLELLVGGRAGDDARVVQQPDAAKVVADGEEVRHSGSGHRVDVRALDAHRRLGARLARRRVFAENSHDLKPQRRRPLAPLRVPKIPDRLPARGRTEVQNLVPAARGAQRARVPGPVDAGDGARVSLAPGPPDEVDVGQFRPGCRRFGKRGTLANLVQAHAPVVTSRGEHVTVGGEGERGDGAAVNAVNGARDAPPHQLPFAPHPSLEQTEQPHLPLARAHREEEPVVEGGGRGGEGDRGGLGRGWIARPDRSQHVLGDGVPHDYSRRPARTRKHPFPVRMPRHREGGARLAAREGPG